MSARAAAADPEIWRRMANAIGVEAVASGDAVPPGYDVDETLKLPGVRPAAVVFPGSTQDVVKIIETAAECRVPVTARGAGTGLSGACVPNPGGLVVSFERMTRIIDIDTSGHVAVVEPGVTLAALDAATAEHGLVYPVFPGTLAATLGGSVATNAGGMRAVKYGVTRHQVLGVEAVLGTGEVIRSGRPVREEHERLRPDPDDRRI